MILLFLFLIIGFLGLICHGGRTVAKRMSLCVKDTDNDSFSRSILIRFRDRYTFFQKNQMIRNRAKAYPRIKVCCGLYSGRRQKKDDSLIREIGRAAAIAPADRQESCDEITLIRVHNENYKEKHIL